MQASGLFSTAEVPSPPVDTFALSEVALAAGVDQEDVWRLVGLGQAVVDGSPPSVSADDAIHLIRVLRGDEPPTAEQAPLNVKRDQSAKKRAKLAAASGIYSLIAASFIFISSLGLFSASSTEEFIPDPAPVRIVYLMDPGPGGGGGGGGLQEKTPPPPAARKAPKPAKRVASPVPPSRPKPAPPPRPRPDPIVPVPAPPPAVQAPVQVVAADPLEAIGLPVERERTAPPSQGRGTQGGVGSGAGQGIGEGDGGGIGPGSGGGIGGGPYQPGAGIDPPTLVREVRPQYTPEARRQAIEGDVVLEIIVRADGSVGNIRVRRSLGAGLEQKAIEAVRQWKFLPAKRHGTPVDVVVDVSVGFKLR